MNQDALDKLIAKEEIRELALLYSRGVDRQDFELLRTLYARGGWDNHAPYYEGPADAFVDFLAQSMPRLHMTGHYVCNHLISVDGDAGEGEVYALAHHIMPDGQGGFVEDLQAVRYVDQYVRQDGRWVFARRDVHFDLHSRRPAPAPEGPSPVSLQDASYTALKSRLFHRGPRA